MAPPLALPPGRPCLQPSGALVPLPSECGPRPAPRRGPSPPPANGRAGRLPPDLASGGTLLPPLPPSGGASPFSLWAETGPLLPAGGWSSSLPRRRRLAPRPSSAGGSRPCRLSLPAGLGSAVICPRLVGSAVSPGPSPCRPIPRERDHQPKGPPRGSHPAPAPPGVRPALTRLLSPGGRWLLRPGGFSLRRRGYPLVAERPFLLQLPPLSPSNTIGPLRVSILPGTPPSPRRPLPWPRPEYPSSSLLGFRPFGAHLGTWRFSPSTHASQHLRFSF